jgi:hypothetical protein
VISFVIGLGAHIGGYLLLASLPREPLGLLADLLHALGWSLWTGVVVAVFVQVIPEAKRLQIKRALDAYEALQREKAHDDSNRKTASAKSSLVRKTNRNRNRKGG